MHKIDRTEGGGDPKIVYFDGFYQFCTWISHVTLTKTKYNARSGFNATPDIKTRQEERDSCHVISIYNFRYFKFASNVIFS